MNDGWDGPVCIGVTSFVFMRDDKEIDDAERQVDIPTKWNII